VEKEKSVGLTAEELDTELVKLFRGIYAKKQAHKQRGKSSGG